jgi:GNAT superfamily N-acetyltransferase
MTTSPSRKEQKRTLQEIKTICHKKYDNIKFYELLRNDLMNKYKNSDLFDIEEDEMTHVMDYFKYTNNSTAIVCNGGILRFGTRAKSIDITRVWVDPRIHRKGLGTILMDIFFRSYISVITRPDVTEDMIPKIILECSGSVGYGDTKQDTSITDQLKFFTKFGFEVVRNDHKNYYVHLELTKSGFKKYVQKYFIDSK